MHAASSIHTCGRASLALGRQRKSKNGRAKTAVTDVVLPRDSGTGLAESGPTWESQTSAKTGSGSPGPGQRGLGARRSAGSQCTHFQEGVASAGRAGATGTAAPGARIRRETRSSGAVVARCWNERKTAAEE